jgi:hypothetical protein
VPIPLATPAPIPLATPARAPVAGSPTPAPVSPPFAAVASVEPAAPSSAGPRPVRPLEKDIFVHDGTRYTGDVLRRAREARGLTVQALSERTRITRHHIEHLEADRYEKLPAPVYLRGILLSIARELRLDGQKVARSYVEEAAAASGAPPRAR